MVSCKHSNFNDKIEQMKDLQKLIENSTHQITDENLNKWKVIETSDLEEIMQAYHQTQLKLLGLQNVRVSAWDDASDEDKIPFLEKAAELAGDSKFCTRVWSAWGVGTMSESDFVDAADDDDFVNDIAKAIWEGH